VDGVSVVPWRWPHVVALIAVTVAGALPRAVRIGAHHGLSWDESYYVPAARAYLDGDFSQNFEHPALGKWAVAAGIQLLGDDPLGWRLAALTCGIATIPLTWLLVRRLLGSPWWATLAAALVATDGMLIVQSRTAILDSLLPPLIVGAALSIVIHLDRVGPSRSSWWLVGAGVLLGAGVAVKWQTGTVLLGVLVAFTVAGRRDRRALAAAAIAFVAVPAVVYVASYAGHFAHGLSPVEWLQMQRRMVDYHKGFRIDHPRDSSAVSWLVMQRPVSYGSTRSDGHIAIDMALGNFVLWWSFLASLPLLIGVWWRSRDRTVELVLLAWATLHLFWFVILRPGFLYYLTPMVPFMAIGVTWACRWLALRWRVARPLAPTIALAAVVVFALYLPVWTYQSISLDRFHDLMLFDGWEP
jgi:dolichyl-phosphate-mannose--protein O-mannosyl transferase